MQLATLDFSRGRQVLALCWFCKKNRALISFWIRTELSFLGSPWLNASLYEETIWFSLNRSLPCNNLEGKTTWQKSRWYKVFFGPSRPRPSTWPHAINSGFQPLLKLLCTFFLPFRRSGSLRNEFLLSCFEKLCLVASSSYRRLKTSGGDGLALTLNEVEYSKRDLDRLWPWKPSLFLRKLKD
jgi:hypothetical protein